MKQSFSSQTERSLSLVPFNRLPKRLATAKTIEVTFGGGFSHHYEVELSYFVPLKSIQSCMDLEQLPRQHIYQVYIPKESIAAALTQVGTHSLQLKGKDPKALTRARLRRVIEHDPKKSSRWTTEYYLQLKSAKSGGVARHELSLTITEEQFKKLLPLATNGAVEKMRFVRSGKIRDASGISHRAEAHIDLLLAAGPTHSIRSRNTKLCTLPSYAFVDIEVSNTKLCSQLGDLNNHTFSFLKNSISLRKTRNGIRKKTTTRKIAELGLKHPHIKKALKELMKQALSLT